MSRGPWIVPIALGWLACQTSPYPGFKRIEEGIDVRLNTLGEGERRPAAKDHVLMRVRIARWDGTPGSLFSTERWYEIKSGSMFMSRVFGRMHEGDSMSVIATGAGVPWDLLAPELLTIPSDTERVRIELSLRELRGPEGPPEVKVEPQVDRAALERELLAAYRDSAHWYAWGEDLYYRIEHRGSDTARIHSGDLVTIDYVGRFLDGRVFDDTQRSGPLTFRLGDPGQVIRGLEVAVHMLRRGGQGTFVIPSALAFGPEGSSSGIVPPYTPVAYDVVIREVRRDGASGEIP